jgi:hypothetical protein
MLFKGFVSVIEFGKADIDKYSGLRSEDEGVGVFVGWVVALDISVARRARLTMKSESKRGTMTGRAGEFESLSKE